MPQEIDELLEDLDHAWEARRSATADTANKAVDALARTKQREQVLGTDEAGETQREQELKEKYNLRSSLN